MNVQHLPQPDWPDWLGPLLRLDAGRTFHQTIAGRFPVVTVEGDDFAFASLTIPGARALDASAFYERVAEAYQALPAAVDRGTGRIPVRFWNYVPGLRRKADDGRDWYMLFNTGRRDGLCRWLDAHTFEDRLPTASAIDAHTDDLVIHLLAAAVPGVALENPRQVSAYRYSSQFGPTPPSFARATALTGDHGHRLKGTVLVGGTASIVGESSCYIGDTDAQLEQTLHNMACLLSREAEPAADTQKWMLARIYALRVYVVHPTEQDRVVARLQQACPNVRQLEVLTADLCRAELRVEVEGVTEPGVLASGPTCTEAAIASPRNNPGRTRSRLYI